MGSSAQTDNRANQPVPAEEEIDFPLELAALPYTSIFFNFFFTFHYSSVHFIAIMMMTNLCV